MQDSTSSKLSVFPSLSTRGLLLLVALAAVVATVAAGAVQGSRVSTTIVAALGLLGATFLLFGMASLVLFAAALVFARRAWQEPGPFRPTRPQAPIPHDLEGLER